MGDSGVARKFFREGLETNNRTGDTYYHKTWEMKNSKKALLLLVGYVPGLFLAGARYFFERIMVPANGCMAFQVLFLPGTMRTTA